MFIAKLPTGKHSVRGLGKMAPNPKQNKVTSGGVLVPLGKQSETGVVNPDGYTLNYNEYIVYNPNQVKMKYLVKIQFNFKLSMKLFSVNSYLVSLPSFNIY